MELSYLQQILLLSFICYFVDISTHSSDILRIRYHGKITMLKERSNTFFSLKKGTIFRVRKLTMFGHTPTTKYFPVGSDSKRSAYNVGDPEFNPWIGKISWRRKWQPTPVFLPGKSHGRSLVGYSPWDRKESDTTERPLSFFISLYELRWRKVFVSVC